VDAILYVLWTGCPWRALPDCYPHWRTVHHHFAHWAADGTLARLHAMLRGRVRGAAGRTVAPTAAVIDSQSVRASDWVVDTDSRYTTPTEAAQRVAAAAERAHGLGARVYKKIDSLLRGNVAAEVAAAARALGSAQRPPWPSWPRPFPPPGGPPWRVWCWCTASRWRHPSTAGSRPCSPRPT